jgi:alkylation response protein AidB-like acyl-CoA dehydrogenase
MTMTEEFDAKLLPEERQFLDRLNEFGETIVAPQAKEWEYARRSPVDVLRQASRQGFASIELPKEYGGLGMRFPVRMRMAEELSKHDAAFTFALIQHHNVMVRIAESAPAEVTQKLLPRMLAGDAIGCTAMSEPAAGSDFSALTTVARKVSGGWRLDGAKGWITNAAIADVFLTYAQTDPGSGSKGIACFIVTSDMPGFERQPAYELHGGHATGVGGYAMKDCFVPDAMQLYPPGAAFKIAMHAVNLARLHVSAMNIGILDSALHTALRYGEQRQAFGKPLLDLQGLAWSLADVAAHLDAMRALAYRGTRLVEQGHDAVEAAAVAKKFSNDYTLRGLTACMQAMGANGLRTKYPLARHLAVAKLFCYTDGTIEMMNERIVHLLRKRTRAG